MKKISKNQYWQLIGLKTLATQLDKQLAEIQKSVSEIIGEDYFDVGDGWSGEPVFTGRSLDDALRCAEIEVEKDDE